jgi:predicted SprT family Zn-dependent metalloprotease
MNPKNTPSQEIYTAVERAYTYFNSHLFANQLPDCLIVLQRQPRMMGYVSPNRWVNANKRFVDELAINPEYFLGYPLIEIMQTLVHEQCHIWQAKFGSPGRRNYHNKEWADKMESIGLMPSHTGMPGGKKTGEHMNDYTIIGGQFQQAYTALITKGFELPWLDRQPLTRRDKSTRLFSIEGSNIEATLTQHQVKTLSITAGEQLTNFSELNIDPTELIESIKINSITLERPKKNNTRIKYRCNSCGNQLWGKPQMNIICGDCNTQFLEWDF